MFNSFKEFPNKYAETFRKFILITFNLTPNRIPGLTGVDVM